MYERDLSVKLGIYDISTGILVAEGYNPFAKNELTNDFCFKRAIVQVKFLRGDVIFDEEQCKILKPWLRSLPQSFIRYFQFVYKNHAKSPFETSKLEEVLFELGGQEKCADFFRMTSSRRQSYESLPNEPTVKKGLLSKRHF